MKRNSFFFLLFAIVVALGFTWLNSTWLSYNGFELNRKSKIVDYYLSDFTLLNTYPNGKMRFLVKGQHLIHQQSTGESQIFSPIIQARDNADGEITITTKHARQDSKNGAIFLKGNVDVEKVSNNPKEDFTLLSSDITYNPLTKELSSNTDITLNSDFGTIKGNGFFTRFDEQELRINKNVQAVLLPTK